MGSDSVAHEAESRGVRLTWVDCKTMLETILNSTNCDKF